MATASMPSSWHARMIRTAISPRFATRTRRNGMPGCPPPAPASLRKDAASSAALERDVAMLLSRVRVALVGHRLERPDQARPRLGWTDDVVDISTRGGDVGVRELCLVFGNEPGVLRCRIRCGGDLV